MSDIKQGIIKKKTDKGFGFIAIEGQEKDVFFHSKSVVGATSFDELNEGDKVEFTEEQTDRGLAAVNVKLVTEGAADLAA